MTCLIYCLGSYPLVTAIFLVLVLDSIVSSLDAFCSLADSVARDFPAVRLPFVSFVRSLLRVLVEREPIFEMRNNVHVTLAGSTMTTTSSDPNGKQSETPNAYKMSPGTYKICNSRTRYKADRAAEHERELNRVINTGLVE